MRLRIRCFLQSGHAAYKCKDRQSSVSRSSRSQQRMFNLCNKLKREDPQERLTLILQQPNLDSYDHLITSKFSDIKWDIRMTSENVTNLKIKSQLTLTEWEILMTVLFNWESTLSWHFSHLKRLWSEVVLSQKIQTISHKTWQISEFQVLRALKKNSLTCWSG
jgi:hypothetical protein